jgi:hypothetical protein
LTFYEHIKNISDAEINLKVSTISRFKAGSMEQLLTILDTEREKSRMCYPVRNLETKRDLPDNDKWKKLSMRMKTLRSFAPTNRDNTKYLVHLLNYADIHITLDEINSNYLSGISPKYHDLVFIVACFCSGVSHVKGRKAQEFLTSMQQCNSGYFMWYDQAQIKTKDGLYTGIGVITGQIHRTPFRLHLRENICTQIESPDPARLKLYSYEMHKIFEKLNIMTADDEYHSVFLRSEHRSWFTTGHGTKIITNKVIREPKMIEFSVELTKDCTLKLIGKMRNITFDAMIHLPKYSYESYNDIEPLNDEDLTPLQIFFEKAKAKWSNNKEASFEEIGAMFFTDREWTSRCLGIRLKSLGRLNTSKTYTEPESQFMETTDIGDEHLAFDENLANELWEFGESDSDDEAEGGFNMFEDLKEILKSTSIEEENEVDIDDFDDFKIESFGDLFDSFKMKDSLNSRMTDAVNNHFFDGLLKNVEEIAGPMPRWTKVPDSIKDDFIINDIPIYYHLILEAGFTEQERKKTSFKF